MLAAALAYLNRRTLAREALTGWLKSRGIASQAQVESVGLSSFVGRLSVGDPARPDFAADRVEVRYQIKGLAFEVQSVRLTAPVLRARFHQGRLSAGALDPLIEEFRRRPPRPDAAKPKIEIKAGTLFLATDFGPLKIGADARVEENELLSLTATVDPARLSRPGFIGDFGRAALSFRKTGPRGDLRFDAPIRQATAGEAKLTDGRLLVTANLPYPDFVKQRGDGALTAAARLTGARLGFGERTAEAADLQMGFTGQATGWLTNLAVTGKATAALRVSGAVADGTRAGPVRASVVSDDVRWTRQGGDRLTATLQMNGTADRLAASSLTLEQVVVAARGPLAVDAKGVTLALGGSALGRGRFSGLGAPVATDSAEMAAVKRAAQGFRFAAPAVQATLGPTLSARLVQPLRILPDRGGEVRLAMVGDGYRIASSGGGLPKVDAALSDVRFTPGRTSAVLAIKAGMSVGPVVGGQVDTAGRLTMAGSSITYAATRCMTISAQRIELEERDIEALSGRFCARGGPMLALEDGRWRVNGRMEAVAARWPFLQARVEGGQGPVAISGSAQRLTALIGIEGGRIADLAAEPRFNPLALTGRAGLADDVLTANLDFATPAGAKVATAGLRHELRTGKGGVDIATGTLTFAEGGLQPADLSPLAAAIGSPATGEASFSGGFAWLPEAGFSVGTLKIARLDFKSPAGQLSGLNGEIAFTSLAPLVAAPGQKLRAARLDALVPITGIEAELEIREETLHIAGGVAAVEGGFVRVESLELPMAPGKPTRGVLAFEGVQLKNLVEASPFADWMDLDAQVTGRIPFEAVDGKVRIAKGDLKAIAPGRLSIRRELFTGAAAQVSADVAGTPVPTGPASPAAPDPNQTFTGMAYQAMENLAFSELDAVVNSTPEGRLGVLFHIKGRHDPPTKQQIRLSVMDIIRQRFMGQALPLPSGTEVNLTLDTTLNLDDLLADYTAFRQTRGSAQVQP